MLALMGGLLNFPGFALGHRDMNGESVGCRGDWAYIHAVGWIYVQLPGDGLEEEMER